MSQPAKDQPRRKPREGKLAPALCNIVGTLLIVVVFALTLPLAVPQYLGYGVYDVISGSMEPAIPVGSVIYVRAVEPEDVQEDEVVAFHDDDVVVAHRVVANRTSLGELVTKGDANNTTDLQPVKYEALVGRVVMHVPYMGKAMALYASVTGKVYLMLTLACGFMLNVLADRMRTVRSLRTMERLRAERAAAQGLAPDGTPLAEVDPEVLAAEAADLAAEAREDAARRRAHRMVRVIMAFLALLFVGSSGVILYVHHQYHVSDEVYKAAQQQFVGEPSEPVVAPIEVDFAELQSVNPDVIGWLYCDGTRINYPVLRGQTNDQYLRHDYTREYNIDGSLFVDCDNSAGFTDANTIIYGHHMNEGAMFGALEDWGEQSFYESHPVFWLLTPDQDYQVVLISGHHTSAYSDMYEIYKEHNENFYRFLSEAVSQSDFEPIEQATVNEDRNYVMLTTCAYIFDNARYVLHGKLVPVDSAGGVAKVAQ